ncbi:MAG: hypothetical protein OHK0029_23750 [Armatimonadaceae bacterium]
MTSHLHPSGPITSEQSERTDPKVADGPGLPTPLSPTQTTERFLRFQKVAAALLECRTPEDCAQTVLTEGIEALGARAGSVVLVNRELNQLELIGAAGYPAHLVDRWRNFPLDAETPISDAARSGVPVHLTSQQERAERYPALAATNSTTDHAWAAAPFLLEGCAFGCLGLSYAEPTLFTEDERSFLQGLAQQCGLAIERARLYETVIAQRTFLRDVLSAVTDGRLSLCDSESDLPAALPLYPDDSGAVALVNEGAIRSLRHAVQQAVAACEFPRDRADDLITAVHEAAANAIVHGGGGEGRVCAEVETGRVQVWISDRGTGIAFHHLPKAMLKKGYTTAGTLGHGFKIILAVMDRVSLLTSGHGTTVVLEQTKISPPPFWL